MNKSGEYFDTFFDEYLTLPFWWGGLINGSVDETLKRVLSPLSPVTGKTILDLGSGIGTFSRGIQEMGATPISVVNSAKCAEYQRGKFSFEVVHSSYLETSIPDNTADAAVFLESFCYERPRETIKEVHRLLKPGGDLIVKCMAPLERQREMISKEDGIWKTKFATHKEIINNVADRLTIIDYHLLNCKTDEFSAFIGERLKEQHAGSNVAAFPYYFLWAKNY